jgi:hypothetical protein
LPASRKQAKADVFAGIDDKVVATAPHGRLAVGSETRLRRPGNILAKQLSFLANADSAGLVLGARVPIVLTSRTDSVRARIASYAVAMLAPRARRRPQAVGV